MLVTTEPSSSNDNGFEEVPDEDPEEEPDESDGNGDDDEEDKMDSGLNDSSQEVEFKGHDEDLELGKSKGVAFEVNDAERLPHDHVDEMPRLQGKEASKEARESLVKQDRDATHLNNKFLPSNEKEVVRNSLVRNHSGYRLLSNVQVSSEEKSSQSGDNTNLRSSSLITPQIRPRGQSSSVECEDKNKIPAISCKIFAKGRCPKGGSCRIAHKRDSVLNTSNTAKDDDEVVESLKGGLQVDAGLRQNAKKSKFSSPESMSSAVVGYPSLCSHFPSERNLLEEHEESQRSGKTSEDHKQLPLTRDDPSLILVNYMGDETVKQNISLEKCSIDASPGVRRVLQKSINPRIDDPTISSSSLIPWNSYLEEDYKQSSQVPSLNSNHHVHSDHMSRNKELVRGYGLVQNNIVPNHSLLSSSAGAASSIYGKHTSFAYGKCGAETSAHEILKSNPVCFDGHASPAFYNLLNSRSEHFLPSMCMPSLQRPFESSRTSPSQGSSPTRHYMLFDSGRGNFSSRSTSLPKTLYSLFYARPEPDDLPSRTATVDRMSYIRYAREYSWEPSVPFQPSFCLPPNLKSSSERQYDPLLDSIELPNVGDKSLQSSSLTEGVVVQNTSQINADSVGLDQRTESVFLDNSKYNHSLPTDAPSSEATRDFVAGKQNNILVTKDEKPLKHDHAVIASNAKEIRLDRSHGKIDGHKHKKESKEQKVFRVSLIDFVKELVKPYWLEGQLSKDMHNVIVKKAVEKVLSTLQPHQIPSTPQFVDQYLLTSLPKLKKLVEGYVSKYVKSELHSK
ncbi:hypothetical protein MKX01_015171 [Papaver californicum]|nr:hypothetical protein MKX01_015171 [Papaver californicum]